MSPPVAIPGTLYADWLRRREQLAAYQGQQEPVVAIQLRVLDYLVDRYRDDSAALAPAPAPLDMVYVNQRAIVVNHHRSLGMVAGVKSAQQAKSRIAGIVARMHDPNRAEAPGIDLTAAPVRDDPWFGWEEPSERVVRAYWRTWTIAWLRVRPDDFLPAMDKMPFLPTGFLNHLHSRAAQLDAEDEWAAAILAKCRNRLGLRYTAHAWRARVAAFKYDHVTSRLREALVNWDRQAADTVRCLLSDDAGDLRMAAALLLAETGELRDIGIFADLLAMPAFADEESEERTVLAHAMEKLAMRVQEPRSALR